jgi:hypothetical protein
MATRMLRARRVIVVYLASLTLKWREEIEAKFGLGFQILDTDQLRELPSVPRTSKPTPSGLPADSHGLGVVGRLIRPPGYR